MSPFTEEEIKAFIAEAEDLLDSAEKSLLSLDKGEPLKVHYDAIFRALHSIKGAAGMMDMFALQSHMHQLETIFVDNKEETNLEKPLIDLFLRGLDGTRTLLGGGTITFDYSVSASPQASPAAATPAPAVPKTEKIENVVVKPAKIGRILIVDDEPELVELIGEILQDENIEVMGLTSPHDVMNALSTFKPNALFSDISMPGMDGLQLLEQVSKAQPDLPVVFLSGHINKDALMQAIRLGVFGVLEKPCDPTKIVEYALNAIEKHRLAKMLSSSINLLMYQFSDLSEFLNTSGRGDVQKVISNEITSLLHQRKSLRVRKRPTAA